MVLFMHEKAIVLFMHEKAMVLFMHEKALVATYTHVRTYQG